VLYEFEVLFQIACAEIAAAGFEDIVRRPDPFPPCQPSEVQSAMLGCRQQ
jgi:hypothetical protein